MGQAINLPTRATSCSSEPERFCSCQYLYAEMGIAAPVPRNATLRHCRNSNLVSQSRAAIRVSKVPQSRCRDRHFCIAALDSIFLKNKINSVQGRSWLRPVVRKIQIKPKKNNKFSRPKYFKIKFLCSRQRRGRGLNSKYCHILTPDSRHASSFTPQNSYIGASVV